MGIVESSRTVDLVESGGCLLSSPNRCGVPASGSGIGASLCGRLDSLCSEFSSTDRGDARRDPRSISGGWLAAAALNFEIDFGFGVGVPALADDDALDLLTAPVELMGVCIA